MDEFLSDDLMETRLRKFRLCAMAQLSKEFACDPRVEWSHFEDSLPSEITVRIIQEVYGEDLGTLHIKRPKNWFEMLKHQYAPEWVLERWPVKHQRWSWEARALYPKLSLPDEEHRVTWVMTSS